MTTDTFVVKPIRFPGGSIGELAVNGTVNDLAVSGARPVALSLSLILEEGLDADVLRAEVEAIAEAAEAAGVEVVTGDTKVVERGHCDSMYICTTGLGQVDSRASLSPASIQPGDRVLVSGTIGEHGTAIMLARGELGLDAEIVSDTRPLWPAVDAAARRRRVVAPLHARRDPRRRRVGAERARPGLGGLDRHPRRRRSDEPGGQRRRRAPRDRPDVRRERGRVGRVRRPRGRRGGARRSCARRPAARAPPRSARSRRSPRAWCSSRPRSAAGGSWTCWPATRCRGSAE